MSEKTNIPQIRFKGFNDVWEQCKLEDIADIYDGIHETPNYKSEGIMFLSVEDITTLVSNKYISFEDFRRLYKVYPQKDDILMTRIGDVGTPNVVENTDLLAYYVSLALIKPKKIDSYYLSNCICSTSFQNDLKQRTLTTAIPQKINKDQIGKIIVNFPSNKSEQILIGGLFSNLDNLITLHQRKHEKYTNIKKALLEKIFPQNGEKIPQIRFKGFTEAWEQCKFGEIMEEVTDYVAAGSFADLAENVKYLSTPDYAQLVRTTDLKANFTNNDFIYVNEHAFNFLWRVNLNKECIIMPNIGNCGEIYFINPNKLPYKHNVLGPNAIFVRSTTNNNKFLSYNFQTETFQKKLKLIISPNGQTKFNKTELKTILTFKAELAEQNKLGDLFEQIDNLITLHQRECEKLKNIKKSLLEKMFV